MSDSPDPLAPEIVQRFVALSHGDLDGVLSLLTDHPSLVNACWDWGGGDWETGLGAAAHMGRADIALALLDRGARMDVFAAACSAECLWCARSSRTIRGSPPPWGHTAFLWRPTHPRGAMTQRRSLPSFARCEAGSNGAKAANLYRSPVGDVRCESKRPSCALQRGSGR